MTDQLTEARDQIAEMCGWSIADTPAQDGDPPRKIWKRGVSLRWDHPIPASLDFVSRVWLDGWVWCKTARGSSREYGAGRLTIAGLGDWCVFVEGGSSELTDRMTLLLKVLVWLRDNDRPAFDAACKKIRKECGK